MNVVSFDEADPLLSWTAVADAIEAGHLLPRARIGDLLLSREDDHLLNRAAWIDGLGMGLKSMSVFPGNASRKPPLPTIQGGMLLFEDKSGAPVAFIDGRLVTKWKTAGDSVLGARLLAPPNPQSLLICGAGTVARSLMAAYREVFPGIRRIAIWNRTPDRAKALAAECAQDDIAIEIVRDLPAAVADADIVASATMAVEPFLQGAWFRPGTHVDLIGAYRPDMREADDDLLQRAELFVDSRETTIGHIGEIQIPLEHGIIAPDEIRGDLYDLCHGAGGRTGPDAITVFKNGGGAHLDLMVGDLIRRVVTVTR